MDATDAKNKLMEDVKLAIRPIRNMADLVFKGKGKYHSFGFKDMANMNAEDLFRLAKRVNNIVCVTTPFPSLECREKRETNIHRNLYKRLALLPFVYNNPLVLILWISSLILAILASLRFWYIYKP
jgi:hypothetical protein